MISELGLFALVLAFFVALIQGLLPLVGAAQKNRLLMEIDRPAACVQFGLVALAFFALVWAYITSDFSVMVVAENSHTDKPLLYKISGAWGNHEGSMLLWSFILALYGLAMATFGRHLPEDLRTRALAVQGLIGAGFLAFILFTSNPFVRLDPAPLNGNGLNPILQDPGLAFHPPFLYLGYVGFSMAFSLAIAALLEGRVDAAWARWVRPWTLVAWCFLTLGIALGAWWAYYTLGWGGWWYWDPVENASLMPWLAGTALLHASIVVEKRDTMKSWTILLAIFAFSLSLLGTFLVRSGILTSVHSFAADPGRGVFVLVLLVLVTGGSLVLFALRASALKSKGLFAPVSREGSILINNILLAVATGTVLLGTLYPLFIDALDLGKVSVGPPFFNMVFGPLMIPVIFAAVLGPMLSWKRGNLPEAFQKLKGSLSLAAVTVVATLFVAGLAPKSLGAALGFGLAAWLFAGSLAEWSERVGLFRLSFEDSRRRALTLPRAAYGMTLAHIGLAITLAGVTGSSAWQTEKLQIMKKGETVDVAGYAFTLDDVQENVKGPNYTATRAVFTVRHGQELIATMRPERRLYTVPPRPTTNVAIHTNFVSDLYAVIGEPNEVDGKRAEGYITRLYHNPLVPWIFVGSLVMVFGGLLSLSDRRYRIGAPRRKREETKPSPSASPQTDTAKTIPPRTRSLLFLVPVITFAVLAGAFTYRLHLIGEGNTPDLIPSVLIGKPVPRFDLPPLLPKTLGAKSEKLKGRVTLINFFASWCQPCRAEHAVLSRFAKSGVDLLGINYKDSTKDATAWLKKLGNPYTLIGQDSYGKTGIDFGVYGVPESYLVDKEGIIRFKHTGPLTDEIITNTVLPLAEKLK